MRTFIKTKHVIAIAGAVCAVAVPMSLAATTGVISTASIAGAKPGGAQDAYAQFLGADAQQEATLQRNPAFSRMFSRTRRAAVFFKKKTGKAVVVTTWNRADRTAAGIGPCSPIARLKKVYGGKLKPVKSETYRSGVYAYRLGNLIFGASGQGHPSSHVTAVGLYANVTEPTGTDFTIGLDRAVC